MIDPETERLFARSGNVPVTYDIENGFQGIGDDLLLEVVSEMDSLEDVQQFMTISQTTFNLREHPRFSAEAVVPMLARQLFDDSIDDSTFNTRLKSFIANPTVINLENEQGQTLLHISLEKGNDYAVDLLIRHGADVNKPDASGKTPLQIAVEKNAIHSAELLVKKGANISQRIGDKTLPQIAYDERKLRLIEVFVSYHPEETLEILPEFNRTPLCLAAQRDCDAIVGTLLTHGADSNARTWDGYTPVYYACKNGNLKMLNALLECGANIHGDFDGKPLIKIAAENGHSNIVDFLAKHGADLSAAYNEDPYRLAPLLRDALEKGNESLIMSYIDSTDREDGLARYIGMTDREGRWLGLIAAGNGNLSIVREILRQFRQEINRGDNKGRTLLYVASFSGHTDIVEELLKPENGASINIQTKDGRTALQAAAENGHFHVVKILLQRGADINLGTVDKNSLLYNAVEEGDLELVQMLVERGAEVGAINEATHKTARQIAEDRQHQGVVEFLIAHEAQ